ncbi:MAG: DUF433 domain-containing protein [Trueperaceae bacterium]|nr:MAG: DUF433 domain-containing protein [Trueperaceae bacterium]
MALRVTAERVPLESDTHGVMRVAGTRVPLETVVEAFNAGASPEEIVLSYPSLELADVYAVIGYYLHHKVEVDEYVVDQERRAEEVRAHYGVDEFSRELRERLLARRAKSCFS